MSTIAAPSHFKMSDYVPGWSVMKPFLVGGTAGCAATVVIQPIDQIKTQIQLIEGTASRNPVTVARNFVAANGVMGLYNGLSAGILRQLTYGMSRLGLFRSMTNHFSEGGKRKLTLGESTLCSLVAGGIGALIGTPADAALIRMQADTTLPMAERRNYKNGVDAMIRMAREEGMRGFFAGATPTIVRGLALNVGMLASYDKLKEFGGQYLGGENTKSNLIFSSIGSGILGATFALPLDLIKTKLQKQRPLPDGKMPFSGMLDCARKTLAAEGPTGFYKGYPTFLLRITPHIVMVWLFMEAFNKSKYLK